jgi:ribosomal protein S28E/S33
MIYNQEQNNLLEGHYLEVIEVITPYKVKVNLPSHFYLVNQPLNNWMLGWGNGTPYYDNGTQNAYSIRSLDAETGIVVLGKRLKGGKKLRKGQQVVFWKRSSTCWNKQMRPLLSTSMFKGFNGKSMSMGGIIHLKKQQCWVMFLTECDVQHKHWYAAYSNNLVNWHPLNSGNPILTSLNFSNQLKVMHWVGMPYISSVMMQGARLVMVLDGENNLHERSMGILTTDLVLDHKRALEIKPICIQHILGEQQKHESFAGKIAKVNQKYRVYFDLKVECGTENVYFVDSKDLKLWSRPVKVSLGYEGWRSSKTSSEPCWVNVHGFEVTLWTAGTKEYVTKIAQRLGCKPHNIGSPGNVQDAQVGVYRSLDGGRTFVAHVNNPVIINDIIDPSEDDHMGGNMALLTTNSGLFYFYQAKSMDGNYTINLRVKR